MQDDETEDEDGPHDDSDDDLDVSKVSYVHLLFVCLI
jgi:hypothetical protein